MNQIEHDPNEAKNLRRAHFWGTFGFLCMMIAISAFAHPVYDTSWQDWAALVAFCLLVSWLRIPSVGRTHEGESTGQRLAFRLGKALHNVLKYLFGNATGRDKAG